MGLDMDLVAARSVEDVKNTPWEDWSIYEEVKNNSAFYNYETGEFTWPRVTSVWYARKFWDLYREIDEFSDSLRYNDCRYVRVNKETLKKMIEFHAFHPDYFEGFSTLPQLCELYQMYDQMQAQGVNLYFFASY